jgi:hypothetical protein
MDYGVRKGLDEDTLPLFWSVITAMDSGFLHWMRTEFARYQRMAPKRRGAGGRTKNRKFAR